MSDRVMDLLNEGKRSRAAAMLIRQAGMELDAVGAMRREASYRLSRALHASAAFDWNVAEREKEESDVLAGGWNRQPRQINSFFVPDHALRDVTTGGAPGLIATPVTAGVPNRSDSFVDLCTVVQANATGTQQIGRFTALPTVTVLATEASSGSEVSPTVSHSALNPSNATTYVELSRQFVVQSETGARAAARLVQNALFNHMQDQICEGAGTSGEVLGLTADSTITTVSGTSLTWATTLAAQEPVEKTGGDGALTWVVSSAAAKLLRARAGVAGGEAILDRDNKIGGYPTRVIGGTTNAFAIFGRWQDMIIYQWQPLEIALNPYAQFQQAIVGLRGWISFNAAVLVSASFSTITSIT